MNKQRFLMDTHVLVWAFNQPQMLNDDTKSILDDDSDEILVCYSPVSLWEIAIKFGLGKLDLLGHTPEEFFEELERSAFICKPLEDETIISSYKLPMHHRDPFDRMLIWEALSSDMTLLSVDAAVDVYQAEGLKTIH